MLEKFKLFQIDSVKMKNVKGGVMDGDLVTTLNCELAGGGTYQVSGVMQEDLWQAIDFFNSRNPGNEIVGCDTGPLMD